jgi:hypothetical protein
VPNIWSYRQERIRNQNDNIAGSSLKSRQSKQEVTIEVREFLEQRAQRRRAYQAKKLLAEFLEQRANARRDYRAAKALGEQPKTPPSGKHARDTSAVDTSDPSMIPMADCMCPHTGLRRIEIQSDVAMQPARQMAGERVGTPTSLRNKKPPLME